MSKRGNPLYDDARSHDRVRYISGTLDGVEKMLRAEEEEEEKAVLFEFAETVPVVTENRFLKRFVLQSYEI